MLLCPDILKAVAPDSLSNLLATSKSIRTIVHRVATRMQKVGPLKLCTDLCTTACSSDSNEVILPADQVSIPRRWIMPISAMASNAVPHGDWCNRHCLSVKMYNWLQHAPTAKTSSWQTTNQYDKHGRACEGELAPSAFLALE